MEELEGREPEPVEAVPSEAELNEAARAAQPEPLPADAPAEFEADPEEPTLAAPPEGEGPAEVPPPRPVPVEASYSLEFSDEEVVRLATGVAAEAAEAAEAAGVAAGALTQAVEPEAEAEGEALPPEEPDDGRRWYVVHCYSGYENKVRHNLEQRIESMGMKGKIFDVVVPTEEELEVREGKRRTVERRVFPGYILVQMVMSEESWYVVRNTPGVTGFVGMGNEPTPLRPEEVAQIVKRMEAEAPRVKVTFKTGQKVRIIDGPFNDFIGTVDALDMEKAKVRVMVSFFGRETPVELDFLQVEKA
jgi:transcriptional antiterminator NusG